MTVESEYRAVLAHDGMTSQDDSPDATTTAGRVDNSNKGSSYAPIEHPSHDNDENNEVVTRAESNQEVYSSPSSSTTTTASSTTTTTTTTARQRRGQLILDGSSNPPPNDNDGGGDDDDLEKQQDDDEDDPFDLDLRFAIAVARSAYRFGTSGNTVENFLESSMVNSGRYKFALTKVTQSELFLTLAQQVDRFGLPRKPVTIMVGVNRGLDLNKLSLLLDLVNNTMNNNDNNDEDNDNITGTNKKFDDNGTRVTTRTIHNAFEQLEQIQKAPTLYGIWTQCLAWIGVGAALAPVLGGSWIDVPSAGILGGVAFGLVQFFERYLSENFQRFDMLTISFVCGALAAAIKVVVSSNLNITLVTLSAVAILLPGYTVSLGVAELVANRIVSGFSNLLNGLLCLVWLALGGWLGASLITSLVANDHIEKTTDIEPVPPIWQVVWIPTLAVGLNLCFQVPKQDCVWGLFIMGGTYASSYGFSRLSTSTSSANLEVLLSSIVMTIASNVWSRFCNRPNVMVLKPAIVFQVSGSIGFRGLITLLEGERFLGTEQFLQMFFVALSVTLGLLVGYALVPANQTLYNMAM